MTEITAAPQARVNDDKLRDLVFSALGHASMCWSDMPSGVFDDVTAVQIGNKLIQDIENLYAEVLNHD